MKKTTLLITVLAVLTVSGAAFSFEGHSKHQMKSLFGHGCFSGIFIDKHVDHLGEVLDLSAQQKDQVTELFEECADEFFAAKENITGSDELIEIGLGLKQKIDARMMEILTEEQQTAFLEFRENHFEHGSEHRIERRVKLMTAGLDLSTEQEDELKRIFETAHQEFSESLQGEPGAETIHNHISEVDQAIQGILDDDQLSKYENLKGLFHEHMSH